MNIKDLTENDIGHWVEYNPGYKKERGRIKSFNETWVFVVYCCDNKWHLFKDYIAAATRPEDLEFVEINCLQCRYLEIDDYIEFGRDITCDKDIELYKKVDMDTYFENKDFFRIISSIGHRKKNKEKFNNELLKAKKCIYFDPS